MGRQRTSRRKTSKTKEYKRSHTKGRYRSKDVDEVQDDIAKEEEQGHKTVFELDDDLPG
jgi:hypothetical protein